MLLMGKLTSSLRAIFDGYVTNCQKMFEYLGGELLGELEISGGEGNKRRFLERFSRTMEENHHGDEEICGSSPGSARDLLSAISFRHEKTGASQGRMQQERLDHL